MLTNPIVKKQQTSVLIPLPKKGKLAAPENWRGISLMPHLTKLFDLLLMLRLRDTMEPLLLPAQNGFRPQRNTAHHIMAFRGLVEHARSHKLPLHGMFVDFSKAFDSVYWDAISTILTMWGTPKLITDAIFKIMYGHEVVVKIENEFSKPISVQKGVLQGDTLAPYLFIIVVDAILRELPVQEGLVLTPKGKKGIRSSERIAAQNKRLNFTTSINALAYADDICLFSRTPAGLQSLFTCLQGVALKVGLQINLGKGKTERFILPSRKLQEKTPVKNLEGTVIPIVDDYKYLGVYALNFREDFDHRKNKAWGILVQYRGIWKSTHSPQLKRTLFMSLVEPIMTYGMAAWELTKSRIQLLNNAFGHMLRYALGLPGGEKTKEHHTEEVYGKLSFLSTTIRTRRLSMFAHFVRAYFREENPEIHLFVPIVLSYMPESSKTLQRSLLEDANCTTRISFVEACLDFPDDIVETCHNSSQKEVWEEIKKRRKHAKNKHARWMKRWRERDDVPLSEIFVT